MVERLPTAKSDRIAKIAYDTGWSALTVAAEARHLQVVEKLLTTKADENAKASYDSGQTDL